MSIELLPLRVSDIVLIQYKRSNTGKVFHGTVTKVLSVHDHNLSFHGGSYTVEIEKFPMAMNAHSSQYNLQCNGVWGDELILVENLTNLEKILYDVD